MRAAGTVAAAALLTEADLTFGNSEANNREIGSAVRVDACVRLVGESQGARRPDAPRPSISLAGNLDQYVTGESMVLRVPVTVPLMGMPPGRMML